MEYSREYLQKVLPEEDPPEGTVPQNVQAELAARRDRLRGEQDPLVERSARWTFAILNELRSGYFTSLDNFFAALNIRFGLGTFFEPVSVGLFDPNSEGVGFGMILQLPRHSGTSSQLVGRIRFPRLSRTFPVAIRHAMFVEHTLPHPTRGTSAAWAQCNVTNQTGLLTAGHVTQGLPPGTRVALTNGLYGTLLISAYPIIDAAFVVTSASHSGLALPIVRFPSAGLPVVVQCQGGPQSRTVVAAMDPLGVTSTMLYRILFHTNSPCSPGDSGALVQTAQGEAVGIYSGSLVTQAVPGGVAGFNQNFEQATYALNVTAFQ